MSAISLRGVTKTFGDVIAVDNVSLEIASGEFFAMLGPSGSGKTTMLRLIAGFELPDAGTIALNGHDVSLKAPFERNVNTVFQDYALFPHMNVLENVAYGLKVKGVSKTERVVRAKDALDRVKLADYGSRKPSQLSGGQRQRVALARALVNEPEVLLLDEPLGALDLKLRQEMQRELKEIQQEVGITFIFVTHDQEEALSMADRIALFNHGRIEQLGSATEIYEHPASEFVAGFVGTSNLLRDEASQRILGKSGTFSIRPEKISISSSGDRRANGIIKNITYRGAHSTITVDLGDGAELNVLHPHDGQHGANLTLGQALEISWNSVHEFQVKP